MFQSSNLYIRQLSSMMTNSPLKGRRKDKHISVLSFILGGAVVPIISLILRSGLSNATITGTGLRLGIKVPRPPIPYPTVRAGATIGRGAWKMR